MKSPVAAHGYYRAASEARRELPCVTFGFGLGNFVFHAFSVEICFYYGFGLSAAAPAAAGVCYYEIHTFLLDGIRKSVRILSESVE